MFWYTTPNYKPLTTWSKVFVSKIFEREKHESIKLNIIGYSHHIEYNASNKTGFTEVLASEIPMSILQDAIEFELKPDIEMQGENWKLWSTEFNQKNLDNFLKDRNVIFYNFDKNQESWTIIRWNFSSNKQVLFQTLHTYPELSLSLWTESKYNL